MEIDNPITTSNAISSKTTVIPELEVLCYLLVLVFLIDQKQYKEVRFAHLKNIFHMVILRIVTTECLHAGKRMCFCGN